VSAAEAVLPAVPRAPAPGGGLLDGPFLVHEAYRGFLIGPEFEFFVVDAATLAPRDCGELVARHSGCGTTVDTEVAIGQVEVRAAPTASLSDLHDELRATLRDLLALAHAARARLLPLALHDTVPARLRETPELEALVGAFGPDFAAHAGTIASDQINVGARDARHAWALYVRFAAWLPELVALAAASPLRRGVPAGVASARLEVYDAAVRRHAEWCGFPHPLASLEDYAALVASLPAFAHPRAYYAYLRPMPQRGVAAEIRCLDKQPRLSDSLALAALCKAIALSEDGDASGPSCDDARARLARARRDGVEGAAGLRAAIDRVAVHLDPDERRLLRPLLRRLSTGSHARRMLDLHGQYGLRGLLRRTIRSFERDLLTTGAPAPTGDPD
jgi:gamma-glutamyl:cysteine ligase YbdK (ATP-grasp superfamily)